MPQCSHSELLAGVGSEIITPSLGCQMAGFDARKGVAESVHDDLHARALVLDNGQTRVALISVEILGLDRSFADRVWSDIEHRTGIPAENVVIAATHTHCGPVTFNHFFNQGQAYVDRLASAISIAAERVFESRNVRRVRSGFVRAEGIAVNRRTADGRPVDPQAGVLSIQQAGGEPACVCVFFACHPTVLGPNTLAITADFPYFTGRKLQSEFGADCHGLFFNGAEGDISVGHRSDLSAGGVIAPFRTFAKAEELGERLANAVIAGYDNLCNEAPTNGHNNPLPTTVHGDSQPAWRTLRLAGRLTWEHPAARILETIAFDADMDGDRVMEQSLQDSRRDDRVVGDGAQLP